LWEGRHDLKTLVFLFFSTGPLVRYATITTNATIRHPMHK
jgi:hypothetical protein